MVTLVTLKEGTETSRRRTDELGYRLERPIHFECKLNEPMHIGMRLLHPAAADHSVSINRQQVQCIFSFRWGAEPGTGPLSWWYRSRGDGTWRLRSLLQGTRVTYVTETFPISRSRRGPTNWDPYQKATDTAPSSVPWRPPVPLLFGAG